MSHFFFFNFKYNDLEYWFLEIYPEFQGNNINSNRKENKKGKPLKEGQRKKESMYQRAGPLGKKLKIINV